MNIETINITTKQLAKVFGVAEKYISELHKLHGMPRSGHNSWSLIDCLQWWINYQKKINEEKIAKLRETKAQDTLALKNAELKEMEIQERRGELVRADDANLFILTLLQTVKNSFKGSNAKVATQLTNIADAKKIQQKLNFEQDKIWSHIGQTKIADVEEKINN